MDSDAIAVAKQENRKFIFVTGGVMSGLGKGVTAASLARLLQARGIRVGIMKCDPYLNFDSGTLNPAEHGEVFVTSDGAETDLDLGYYERFLNIEMSQSSSLMSGRIYSKVLGKERKGLYLGKTVQVVPHITDECINSIVVSANDNQSEVHFVEIGGTVGDYESLAFYEAIRQCRRIFGKDNCLYIHLVYLPYLKASNEVKTKVAQNSVRELRKLGITADLLAVRADQDFDNHILRKLSLTCDLDMEAIIKLPNLSSIYHVPLFIEKQNTANYICKLLKLSPSTPNLKSLEKLSLLIAKPKSVVKIGLVAKYLDNSDTYASVNEALLHAGWQNNVDVEIVSIDSELPSQEICQMLQDVDGLIIPGGFGSRGLEGKITAVNWARLNQKPILGICLGFQMMVVEYARNVLKIKKAHSVESVDQDIVPVITLMEDQKNKDLGGSMRLGDYKNIVDKKSRLYALYHSNNITERHRHRYEFNNVYRADLEKAGLTISATTIDEILVEAVEVSDHPFFIGVQFHPEFKSRPEFPHPLFLGLIKASLSH